MDQVNHRKNMISFHPNIRIVQLVVGVIFLINISCAVVFILQPQKYMGGFEISGDQGRVLVQALGILFLMWNVTYPPVIFNPMKHMTLFRIIIFQQAIGVIGESWLMLSLPTGHTALRATGLRFIFFDGLGLVLMLLAYLLMIKKPENSSDK